MRDGLVTVFGAEVTASEHKNPHHRIRESEGLGLIIFFRPFPRVSRCENVALIRGRIKNKKPR
jgi:hypothetical protein